MAIKSKKIRTRIAPSPTGSLHLGTARTALANYLFAKKNGGKFVLRIEDTDLERSEEKFVYEIIQSFKWLSLEYDEGPKLKNGSGIVEIGDNGPYFQSKRKSIYKKHIGRLIKEEKIFWCGHNKEELAAEKQDQKLRGEPPRHICSDYGRNAVKVKNDSILRFRTPSKKIKFNDLIRGNLEFDVGLLGDIGVARDESTPLYNLASAIDDYEMNITHVIRGEDHIPNTPKQILFFEALGFESPIYAHLPLILGPDKSKLSKRHGAVSIDDYRAQGYLPEALINFIIFLGWNPGTTEEIFSLNEMVEKFALERVHKGGAVFNIERLNWINGYYIRNKNLKDLVADVLPFLRADGLIKENENGEYVERVLALEQGRMKKLFDITQTSRYFFEDEVLCDVDLLRWKDMKNSDIKLSLQKVYDVLSMVEDGRFSKENIGRKLESIIGGGGDKGSVYWPFRVALSGLKASPGPSEIAAVLGKDKTLKRVSNAINSIK